MKPKNRLVPWLFSTPALAIYIFTVLVPVVWSMVYSFFDYNGVSNMNFVGLDNYFQLFQDKVFKTSVMNNLIFMAISTVFQLFMGLFAGDDSYKHYQRQQHFKSRLFYSLYYILYGYLPDLCKASFRTAGRSSGRFDESHGNGAGSRIIRPQAGAPSCFNY